MDKQESVLSNGADILTVGSYALIVIMLPVKGIKSLTTVMAEDYQKS